MRADKDYYAVLGVRPWADKTTIAAAYDRLSRRYQPDVNAEPLDAERLRELDEAFDVLDDARRRAVYNESCDVPVKYHFDARSIAGWLGAIGWVAVILGIVFEALWAVVGLGGSLATCTGDKSDRPIDDAATCVALGVGSWLGVALVLSLYFIVPALLFFAGRHILLLLSEIAEKD